MSARRVALLAAGLALGAVACGGGDLSEHHAADLYSRAPIAAVPDRTADVGAELTDGTYWAEAVAADPDAGTIDFTLTQAVFGADGEMQVIGDPSLDVTVPTGELTTVTVAAESRENYGIDAKELARLVHGDAPADSAPDGYAFTPFPFLLTVVDGAVVEARQVWMA